MKKLIFCCGIVAAGFSVSQGWALEAVAQSPVGAGSAAGAVNLANDAKVSAVKTETLLIKQKVTTLETQLKEELKHVTDCAAAGQLWNGTVCVPISGTPGANGRDGKDGKDVTLPNCTVSQTLVVRDGALACADISSTTDNSAPGTLCGLASDPGSSSVLASRSGPTFVLPCKGRAILKALPGSRIATESNCPEGYGLVNFCSGGGGGGGGGPMMGDTPGAAAAPADPACFWTCGKR